MKIPMISNMIDKITVTPSIKYFISSYFTFMMCMGMVPFIEMFDLIKGFDGRYMIFVYIPLSMFIIYSMTRISNYIIYGIHDKKLSYVFTDKGQTIILLISIYAILLFVTSLALMYYGDILNSLFPTIAEMRQNLLIDFLFLFFSPIVAVMMIFTYVLNVNFKRQWEIANQHHLMQR